MGFLEKSKHSMRWRLAAAALMIVLPCNSAFQISSTKALKGLDRALVCHGKLELRQQCFSKTHPLRHPPAVQMSSAAAPRIALTRELGKNSKLEKLLVSKGLQVDEIPCIAFETGPDVEQLPQALKGKEWEYVVVTSPEAADVFLEGWEKAGRPAVRVASVGSATEQVLKQGGVNCVFTPSKATGKCLAEELPGPSGNGAVLYPASSRARTEVQSGLAARGFACTRLNTYDTVSATWTPQQSAAAKAAAIVTLASPSAVKVWSERVGTAMPAACIGETSAAACKESGFTRVFWPEKPGMDGWVQAVLDALQQL